jgi:hypothetical protein
VRFMPTPTTARRAAALAAAAAVAALTTGSAVAAPATDAVCTSLMPLAITPGFTMAGGAGTTTSGGQTGTLICAGTEYGHRITGPGTLGVVEAYKTDAGCLSDSSTGQVTATLPTTGGTIRIVGALTEHRLGLVATIGIAFPQARFDGVAAIAPTDGLCLLSPLTQALVSTSGTFLG